jgi:hypothetical protein
LDQQDEIRESRELSSGNEITSGSEASRDETSGNKAEMGKKWKVSAQQESRRTLAGSEQVQFREARQKVQGKQATDKAREERYGDGSCARRNDTPNPPAYQKGTTDFPSLKF